MKNMIGKFEHVSLSLLVLSAVTSAFAPSFSYNSHHQEISVTNMFPSKASVSSSSMAKQSSALHSKSDFNTKFMWNSGGAYGKGDFKFYNNFQDWMSPFPDEDRELYPELFQLPKGVYEIVLPKPLGIVFEEVELGRGVYVCDLVEGGVAERQGFIEKDDVLIGITAIKIVGAKYERRLIPAKDLSFDTIVSAIGSNESKWGCDNVVLQFARPSLVEDEEEIQAHLAFFNPPGDNPWRTG